MPRPDLLAAASARRARLPEVADGSTTAFRLVDGASDGWPGVEVDRYGDHFVVQTRDVPFPDSLRHSLPDRCRSLWWKRLDQQDKQAPECLVGDAPRGPYPVRELGLRYEIDLTAGYSQGLFPDQRPQRSRLMQRLQPGHRILNLFAYTCAFSVAAASRGALTTSGDLSRPCLDWGKRNFALNDLDPEAHFFCRGDAFDWLRRFAKKGRAWDGIILDPPTFSRNADTRVFRSARAYPIPVNRPPLLDTAGILFIIFTMSGFHTGDLNLSGTRPCWANTGFFPNILTASSSIRRDHTPINPEVGARLRSGAG